MSVAHSYSSNLANLLVMTTQTGEGAVDALFSQYQQLATLADEVEGCREFMVVISNRLMRDSIAGMACRVVIGAIISTTNIATDLYAIGAYHRSGQLVMQANLMLAMMGLNFLLQVAFILAHYKKSSWTTKLKEVMISASFFRPLVDAYRVCCSTEEDKKMNAVLNFKAIELGTESIPCCVVQICVWLVDFENVNSLALFSILVSALTTGYMSSLIAFGADVDVRLRR